MSRLTPARLARPGRLPARYRFGVIAAILVGAAVLNVVQIPWVESRLIAERLGMLADRLSGRDDSTDVAAFTYRSCAWCSQRNGMYLALAAVAPGARVYIPTPSAYQEPISFKYGEHHDGKNHAADVAAKMYTFGRAASVSWVASPAAAGPGIDPMPYVLASGPGGDKGAPWLLAVDPSRRPPGANGNPDDFLTDVVTGEGPAHSAPVRTFVLISWRQPRDGSTYPYQDLLIEASVLPASLREGLG